MSLLTARYALIPMAVCACAAPALADDTPNLLTAPFTVSLGTFILNTDPKVQLNGDTTTGDTIDFNKTAKGSSASRFRIDGAWRFGDTDRHRLKGFVFNISRSRSETIDQDIVWGDNTYPLDAKVDFKYGFTIVELAYEYEFLKRDTWEIGASAGVHYAQFRAELHAKAVDSNGTLKFDQSNKASVDAPLPVFGLQGTWQLPANLWLNVSGQWFALSIDEYDGNLQDYRAVLTWQPSRWVGIGVGYDRFAVNVDVRKRDFDGSLDWTYDGPMIFYNVSF